MSEGNVMIEVAIFTGIAVALVVWAICVR